MRKNIEIIAVTLFVQVVLSGAIWQAQAQVEKASYPAMASLDQYLIPDKDSELALARSAAPKSISEGAEVKELASTSDVFCSGRCGAELGSESARFADYRGE